MCDVCGANGVKHLNDELGLIRRCPACMSRLCEWAPAAATLALSDVQCLVNHVHTLAVPDSLSRHAVCAQASSSSHQTANRLKSWFPPCYYFASSLSLPSLPSLPPYIHSLPPFPSSLTPLPPVLPLSSLPLRSFDAFLCISLCI